MVIFLIKGSILKTSLIDYVLNDFIEFYNEEGSRSLLKKQDYEELDKIKIDPEYLTKSSIFDKIEPFILPFYDKVGRQHI